MSSPLRLYYVHFENCQACGSSEDDNTSIIQLRRADGSPVATLCWRCLEPHVEELYTNPPDDGS